MDGERKWRLFPDGCLTLLGVVLLLVFVGWVIASWF